LTMVTHTSVILDTQVKIIVSLESQNIEYFQVKIVSTSQQYS
jgi:hypothetical protein